jgi:hypothetical protein
LRGFFNWEWVVRKWLNSDGSDRAGALAKEVRDTELMPRALLVVASGAVHGTPE